MKTKLKKFTAFAAELLPHEADYLLAQHQFEDADKRAILERMYANAHQQGRHEPYDTSLDKRKYSGVMHWVQRKLDAIDVDRYFAWINEMDRKVMTDALSHDEVRTLLRRIRTYEQPIHNFMKFFELALNFRHYLLIRLRYQDYELVNAFIANYQADYTRSKQVNAQLHEATVEIIRQYRDPEQTASTSRWESWLREQFSDPTLDGSNRYMAVVRLTFLYFNTREFTRLQEVYDELDALLSQGLFYTRRILYNYYANRLMLHAKFDVLQQAEEYGYLSIRQKNADQVQYLSNFSSILIRRGKVEEALQLLQEAFTEVQKSTNFYHKIGFISFYIKCLNLNQQMERGALLAEGFLRMHKKEILEQRWYSFFSAYLQSLMLARKFEQVITVYKKYHLELKDQQDRRKDIYLPTVRWYYEIAQLQEHQLESREVCASIVDFVQGQRHDRHKVLIIGKLLQELERYVPRAVTQAQALLHTKKVSA